MADKYERCPFCGNDNMTIITREGKDGFRDRYCVVCDYNDGGCGASSGWYHTPEEATYSWNRRIDNWISVEDELPIYSKIKTYDIWVYSRFRGIHSATYVENREPDETFGDWWTDYDDAEWHPIPGITHWMPRLSPPEKE